VETPAPLRGADGTFVQSLPSLFGFPTRSAVAFEFAPGREPAADADLPGWFRTLGALTARMHSHARGWIPPGGFQRKIWDFDSMFGTQAYWGPWRAGVGLDAAGTTLMDRAVMLIRTRLERFGRSPERFGLIHADLRLANLIVDEPHLRVIDFDDCGCMTSRLPSASLSMNPSWTSCARSGWTVTVPSRRFRKRMPTNCRFSSPYAVFF
jgi:Ser/Thr protein kinase RdoA (MazF antagonist)